jgi:hypothetical protein
MYGYAIYSGIEGKKMSELNSWLNAKEQLENAGQQATITYACVCDKIKELTITQRATAKLALIMANQ